MKFNFSLQKKLLINNAFYLIPITILLYLIYSGYSKDINFAESEILGADINKVAISLLQKTVDGTLDSADAKKEIGALVEKKAKYANDLNFEKTALKTKGKESLFDEAFASTTKAMQTPRVDQAAAFGMLNDLVSYVGDSSNLILDPDLDTYYLMDATIYGVPQIVGRFNDVNTFLKANNSNLSNLSKKEILQLNSLIEILKSVDTGKIMGDLDTSLKEDKNFNGENALLQGEVKTNLAALDKSLKDYIGLLEKVVTGKEFTHAELTKGSATLSKDLSGFENKAVDALTEMLHSRIDGIKAHRTKSLAFGLLAVIIALLVSAYLLKNIIEFEAENQKNTVIALRSNRMVQASPVGTMMSNPEGIFTDINDISVKNLMTMQKYIPEKVDQLIGKSIDNIFQKNSDKIRRLIVEPSNMPYREIVDIGPEKLNFLIGAIISHEGKYLGPMFTWEIVTDKVNLVADLSKASDNLAGAASNVLAISSNLSAAAEQTSAQANTASVASEEVNAGVQTVAGSMEEMVASIKEITKVTNEASALTESAMKMALNADKIINQLGESSQDIGNVTKVISSIAQQTNLLALNATIEAARAGEAGKGFAVVANEVKELAKQTAKATSDITKKIETIQEASQNAVTAIAEISEAIERVNGFAANIASSVEEQAATTNEVTRIVTESAEGVKQISENINQVSQAASNTGRDAGNAQTASRSVGDIAVQLKGYVDRLKI